MILLREFGHRLDMGGLGSPEKYTESGQDGKVCCRSSFRAAYGCPQLVFFPGFDSFFRFKRDRSMCLWAFLQRIKICPSWTFVLVLAFKQFCLVGILRPIPYARARNHSEVASDVVESRKHLGHQLQQQIIISRKQAFCITSNKARQFQPP